MKYYGMLCIGCCAVVLGLLAACSDDDETAKEGIDASSSIESGGTGSSLEEAISSGGGMPSVSSLAAGSRSSGASLPPAGASTSSASAGGISSQGGTVSQSGGASQPAVSSSSLSSTTASSQSSSSSSQSTGGLVTLRVFSGRIVCDTEDDAGAEAEFYGTCEVGAVCQGVSLQAMDGGYPVSGYLWEVESIRAEEWALQPGQSKSFSRQRSFRLDADELAACTLTIKAHVLENDTFGSDDLGWRELAVSGSAIPAGVAWLPAFSDGGTTARIGVMIELLTE